MAEALRAVLVAPFADMVANPAFLIEVLLGGIASGLMYSLVALGFVLIFKASGVFNFAQGIMVVFAALTLVGLYEKGIPAFVALGLTIVVMFVLGLVVSPWVIFAFPAALLVGFAFASVGMAATSFMKSWQDFDLIQLVVLPLFLFSATFYPIETYPPVLQVIVRLTPLYQGVDLIRSLTVGYITPVILFHIAYLAVLGFAGLFVVSRRLDKLLLT